MAQGQVQARVQGQAQGLVQAMERGTRFLGRDRDQVREKAQAMARALGMELETVRASRHLASHRLHPVGMAGRGYLAHRGQSLLGARAAVPGWGWHHHHHRRHNRPIRRHSAQGWSTAPNGKNACSG